MTTFEERERAFENKFSHEQEVLFEIQVRRARLLGLWAAEQMKLGRWRRPRMPARSSMPTSKKPAPPISSDASVPTWKVMGVDISRHRVEKEAELLLTLAHDQVKRE